MALNLLDSLSTPASASDKNAFSSKSKGETDAPHANFGQLLRDSIPGLSSPDTELTPVGEKSGEDKSTSARQKVATEDSDEASLKDGSMAMLLGMPAAALPMASTHLTAWVLSPNMTAITPDQPAPDTRSLTAFAKSQGLDEAVAAWLLTSGHPAPHAGQPTAQPSSVSSPDTAAQATLTLPGSLNPPTPGFQASVQLLQALPRVSPSGPQGTITIDAANQGEAAAATNTLLVPLPPAAMPAAWWTQRLQATGKTTSAAASSSPETSTKSTVHTSDLDLSAMLASDPAAPPTMPAHTSDPSFTPAAWLMPGATPTTDLAATSLVRVLSNDKDSSADTEPMDGLGTAHVDHSASLNKGTDPGPSGTAKTFQSSLSAAERAEQHQAQAEKMGQAIGQRMLSEMEKGHWHLKMMLRPANLGHIEVEMRLRNGELDAQFTASQATTRDLLQDGLPKLKDTLTQMGMDVASMNIGDGSSQKNGGDPTPQQAQTRTTAAQKPTEQQEEQPVMSGTQVNTSGQDGLDVLV